MTNIQRKKHYLDALGIDVWQKKAPKTAKNKEQAQKNIVIPKKTQNDLQPKDPEILAQWENLKEKIKNCSLCDLCKSRTQTVFGVGNKNADLMLIGEAPGANEDLQGEPFVGRGGMLLNSMLQAISLERTQVFIANILKCRPPGNRDPLPAEVELCTPFLEQQISLINPKLIVAVGRIAAHFLLKTEESMANLRGHTYDYGAQKIPLLVIYHPAYLLRSPREKKKAYSDLLLIEKMLKEIYCKK